MQTDYDVLQKKHEHLVRLVARMRNAQKEYLKYYARSDLEIMKRLQREVDKMLEEEVKSIKSIQNNIVFKA